MTNQDKACVHKWEDAQLRTTRDGLYIASVDYCAQCGTQSFSLALQAAREEITRLKEEVASLDRSETREWERGDFFRDKLEQAQAEIAQLKAQLSDAIEASSIAESARLNAQ